MSNSSHPTTPAGSDISMGDILVMAPEDGPLADGVRAMLVSAWEGYDPQDIANLGVPGVAKELLVILPDGSTDPRDDQPFNNTKRLAIARAVISLLGSFDYHKADTAAQAAVPQVVRIERNYSEMSLRQLLMAVITDPDTYDEAKRYINSHPELAAALRKTFEWVVPLMEQLDDEPNIDVDATIKYVTALSQNFYRAQSVLEDGRRPMSLDRAMGVDNRPLVHPLLGVLVRGPMDGFNFYELLQRDPDLYDAAIWARKTKHRLQPDLADIFAACDELFQDPASRRWTRIKADYLTAKERQHSDALSIVHFWPEDLPENGSIFVVAATVDYEALVREAANLVAPLSRSGMGVSVRGGVYTTINVSGMNAYFDGPVVLYGGDVSGMGVSGVIYMPPGRTIEASGMGSNVRVINQTWKQLAERLGLV